MVTYSRYCKFCEEKVTIDPGNSDEAKVLALMCVTSSDSFAVISDRLSELMEEHLLTCKKQ